MVRFPKIRTMNGGMECVTFCFVLFCSVFCCYKLSYMLFMYCTHQCWHWITSGAHRASKWQRCGREASGMNARKMVGGKFLRASGRSVEWKDEWMRTLECIYTFIQFYSMCVCVFVLYSFSLFESACYCSCFWLVHHKHIVLWIFRNGFLN